MVEDRGDCREGDEGGKELEEEQRGLRYSIRVSLAVIEKRSSRTYHGKRRKDGDEAVDRLKIELLGDEGVSRARQQEQARTH